MRWLAIPCTAPPMPLQHTDNPLGSIPTAIGVSASSVCCKLKAPQVSIVNAVVQVLLNGVDIRTVPLQWLRQQVGLVSQVSIALL